jgi:DNA-binding MarR family transcriptional regulator
VRGLKLLTSVEALGREYSFSQALIMQVLLSQREMQMKELAHYLGLSKANVSGLVDRLVRRGLVEREHGVSDRRTVIVRLSPVGRRVATGLVRVQRRGLAQMMRRIPDRDLGVFIETLEKLALAMAGSQRDLLPPARR